MFLLKKSSLIYNYKKYQKNIYKYSNLALERGKIKDKIYYLNKKMFSKIPQNLSIMLF